MKAETLGRSVGIHVRMGCQRSGGGRFAPEALREHLAAHDAAQAVAWSGYRAPQPQPGDLL